MGMNGYQHMVLDDYVLRLSEKRAEREERFATVKNRAGLEAYRARCLRAVKKAFSPRPPKTPLNPRITGRVQKQGYRIEKLLIESRPGYLVSANLYVPEDREGPFPVVLGVCGHSAEGKAAPAYHGFCQRLVVNGFMVLIYEPCNQGERDQYADVPNRECVSGCCAAHNMMGKQLELLGEYYGMWRAWDGVRCLDYLLSRPEADSSCVGLTGNSGGGTMSEWLWAIDDRFTMAAPSCFVTTFMCNLENELPADAEQYPPGVIGSGLEMVDLMVPRAPKPLLLLGQKYDFFDCRGLEEAFINLRRIYFKLGKTENVQLFVGPTTHGYSEHNQKAMVEFFCKHAGKDSVIEIESPEPLTPDELQVTEDGEIIHTGSRPIFELISEKAGEFAGNRPVLAGEDLRQAVAKALVLPRWRADAVGVPHYRVPRSCRIGQHTCARYAVETERQIRAILKKRLVNSAHGHTLDLEGEIHLYIPHLSCEEAMAEGTWASEINPDGALYAVDPRGLGESMPEPHGGAGFLQPYGMDYMMHGYGILFGESYCGRRVFDVLRTIELLRAEGAEIVHLYGRGQGALLALYAAVVDGDITSVTLRNGPTSYREWADAPIVMWPSANFVRGALKTFDLPDLVAELGNRVRIEEPWGPDMRPVE